MSFRHVLIILGGLLYSLAQSLQHLAYTFQPWNQPFLQSLVFKNQDLDARCAHCYRGVAAFRPFQWTCALIHTLHKIFSDLHFKFSVVCWRCICTDMKRFLLLFCSVFALYYRVWVYHYLTVLYQWTFRLFPISYSKNSGEFVNQIIVNTHKYLSLLDPQKQNFWVKELF